MTKELTITKKSNGVQDIILICLYINNSCSGCSSFNSIKKAKKAMEYYINKRGYVINVMACDSDLLSGLE